MFRGYHQHDTQEFLRCFMDQLHEELKHAVPPVTPADQQPGQGSVAERQSGAGSCDTLDNYSLAEGNAAAAADWGFGGPAGYEAVEGDGASASQSEGEYETCDSGVSERSSLSDDTERSASETSRRASTSTKRRLSRSGSPGRTARLRSRLTSAHQRSVSPPVSIVVESQPSTSGMGSSAASSNNNVQGTNSSGLKKSLKYKSIISDVFDGKLLSSVQCLTCDRVSVLFIKQICEKKINNIFPDIHSSRNIPRPLSADPEPRPFSSPPRDRIS